MKVVHLNTSVNKSSAPYRLHEALCRNGIESKILVLNGDEGLHGVYKVKRTLAYKCKRKIYSFLRNQKMKAYVPMEYMPLTTMPVGMELSHVKEIREADIIYLHWVCGDFMSPKTIRSLLKLGKPVFWACHDNFPFTGGCHVRLGCERYQEQCGMCPQLGSENQDDITEKLIAEKMMLSEFPDLYITSPSRWMDGNVSRSAVFGKQRHFILPNTIDTLVFRPFDKEQVRGEFGIEEDSFVILAGLKANEKIPYNGTDLLWETFRGLEELYPQRKLEGRKIELAVFGVESLDAKCSWPVRNLGYIRDEKKLAKVYSAADVYVVTSLEDSFNQTVAECMACETPVVAFKNGGIEDIIDHEVNGYLSEYKNVKDMMRGIIWLENRNCGEVARKKICDNFSYEKVSRQFKSIVNQVTANQI